MLFAYLMMLTFESAHEAAQFDKFILDTSRSFRDKYSTNIVCLSHLNDKNFRQKIHASTSCKIHIIIYLGPVWIQWKEKEKEQNFCSFAIFLHFWIQTPQSAKGQMLP
jgi:hypothetical protein